MDNRQELGYFVCKDQSKIHYAMKRIWAKVSYECFVNSCTYLLFFLPGCNSVGDTFVILLLSSGEEEWDPWLEIECRIGIGGIWFILCKMHVLLSSGWFIGNKGGTCSIGNNEEGTNPEWRNGRFGRGFMKEFKLVYGGVP